MKACCTSDEAEEEEQQQAALAELASLDVKINKVRYQPGMSHTNACLSSAGILTKGNGWLITTWLQSYALTLGVESDERRLETAATAIRAAVRADRPLVVRGVAPEVASHFHAEALYGVSSDFKVHSDVSVIGASTLRRCNRMISVR